MRQSPRSLKAEEGESQDGADKRCTVQEVLGARVREERGQQDGDVPGLLVEMHWGACLFRGRIPDDNLIELMFDSGMR